jgi:hypothetical protein
LSFVTAFTEELAVELPVAALLLSAQPLSMRATTATSAGSACLARIDDPFSIVLRVGASSSKGHWWSMNRKQWLGIR